LSAELDESARLERNIRLYSVYLPLSRIYFFAPIFFLYFSSRFSLAQVLVLGTVYYWSVVVFELPSGYLSDQLGRVTTLRLSSIAMSLSYWLFLAGGERFEVFVVAQILLGAGYATISGSDTAFHFDTLAGLGREAEFGEREAARARDGYIAGGLGAVLAGVLGLWHLELAYVLALVNSIVLLGLSTALHEPARSEDGWASGPLHRQIGSCLRALRSRYLLWLFGYGVVLVSLAHVPSEFTQPYVAAVLGDDMRDVERTPLVAGLLYGINTLVAALAASRSFALVRRFGLVPTLMGGTGLQVILIACMSWSVSPWVASLLLLRSCYPAVSQVILNAEVTPRLPQSLRSSYLSLTSLAGRLGYGLLLLGLSALAGPEGPNDPVMLSVLLRWTAVLAAAGWLILFVTRSGGGDEHRFPDAPGAD